MSGPRKPLHYTCNCDASKNIGNCDAPALAEVDRMSVDELRTYARELEVSAEVARAHLKFANSLRDRKQSFAAILDDRNKYKGNILSDLRDRIKEAEDALRKPPLKDPNQWSYDLVRYTERKAFDELKEQHDNLKMAYSEQERKLKDLRRLLDQKTTVGNLTNHDLDLIVLRLEKHAAVDNDLLEKVESREKKTLSGYQQLHPRIKAEAAEIVRLAEQKVSRVMQENRELQGHAAKSAQFDQAQADVQNMRTALDNERQKVSQLTTQHDDLKKQAQKQSEYINQLRSNYSNNGPVQQRIQNYVNEYRSQAQTARQEKDVAERSLRSECTKSTQLQARADTLEVEMNTLTQQHQATVQGLNLKMTRLETLLYRQEMTGQGDAQQITPPDGNAAAIQAAQMHNQSPMQTYAQARQTHLKAAQTQSPSPSQRMSNLNPDGAAMAQMEMRRHQSLTMQAIQNQHGQTYSRVGTPVQAQYGVIQGQNHPQSPMMNPSMAAGSQGMRPQIRQPPRQSPLQTQLYATNSPITHAGQEQQRLSDPSPETPQMASTSSPVMSMGTPSSSLGQSFMQQRQLPYAALPGASANGMQGNGNQGYFQQNQNVQMNDNDGQDWDGMFTGGSLEGGDYEVGKRLNDQINTPGFDGSLFAQGDYTNSMSVSNSDHTPTKANGADVAGMKRAAESPAAHSPKKSRPTNEFGNMATQTNFW